MNKIRVAAVAGMLSLSMGGVLFSNAAAAEASAGPHANCVAVLTSYFGPQGQVDDAVRTLKAMAAERGMTFGQLARMLAAQHGDVNSCLAFLGLPPVG